MKKIITIILAFLVAALPVMASHQMSPYGSMYNTPDFRPYYGYDYKPYYRDYFERNDFKRDRNYRNYREVAHYQQARSPYVIVHSPYGQKPWHKPYGDSSARETLQRTTNTRQLQRTANTNVDSYNPFYGFPHYRSYHCHGPYACHYHNIFPNSPNH